jgi:hypothetical protein
MVIVGDDAPTDPALETIFTMIETSVEIVATFEDRDATFDPGMPFTSFAEPRLLLVLAAFLRLFTRSGLDNYLDASVGFGLIVSGEPTPVGAGLGRWLAKELLVGLQAGLPLDFVARVAIEHCPAEWTSFRSLRSSDSV